LDKAALPLKGPWRLRPVSAEVFFAGKSYYNQPGLKEEADTRMIIRRYRVADKMHG
jgi:hypothetical protein